LFYKFNSNIKNTKPKTISNTSLHSLLNTLNIPYSSQVQYEIAFTHKSVINEKDNILDCNERLEFLGDSILSLIVTEYLFHNFPNKDEGSLSKLKSYLVSEEVLYKICDKLNLNEFLILGKGELLTGGKDRKSIKANLVEALLGAIYLDLGYDATKKWFLPHLLPFLNKNETFNSRDPKTILQEFIQKKWKILPTYTILEENGPEHQKEFHVKVSVKGFEAIGKGQNKKTAEQNAAHNLWIQIKKKKID
jgi:ribonuclease III